MKYRIFSASAACLLAAVLMGSLGVFVREAGCSSDITAFVRFGIGFILCAPFALFGREKLRFDWHAVLAGFSIAVCIVTYFMAMLSGGLGIAAFVMYLGPILAAIGEFIFFKRRPSRAQILLIAAAFAGLICVSSTAFDSIFGAGSAKDGTAACLLYALISAFCYAAYILFNRKIPEHMSLMNRCFWQFAAGTVLCGALVLVRAGESTFTLEHWPYLLTIGIVHGFAVILLVAYATRYLTAIQYGTIAYIEPIVALFAGMLFYHEAATVLQYAGFILILGAAMIQTLLTFRVQTQGECHV